MKKTAEQSFAIVAVFILQIGVCAAAPMSDDLATAFEGLQARVGKVSADQKQASQTPPAAPTKASSSCSGLEKLERNFTVTTSFSNGRPSLTIPMTYSNCVHADRNDYIVGNTVDYFTTPAGDVMEITTNDESGVVEPREGPNMSYVELSGGKSKHAWSTGSSRVAALPPIDNDELASGKTVQLGDVVFNDGTGAVKTTVTISAEKPAVRAKLTVRLSKSGAVDSVTYDGPKGHRVIAQKDLDRLQIDIPELQTRYDVWTLLPAGLKYQADHRQQGTVWPYDDDACVKQVEKVIDALAAK